MKRLSRLAALAISLAVFVGTVGAMTAARPTGVSSVPTSVKSYVESLG